MNDSTLSASSCCACKTLSPPLHMDSMECAGTSGVKQEVHGDGGREMDAHRPFLSRNCVLTTMRYLEVVASTLQEMECAWIGPSRFSASSRASVCSVPLLQRTAEHATLDMKSGKGCNFRWMLGCEVDADHEPQNCRMQSCTRKAAHELASYNATQQ